MANYEFEKLNLKTGNFVTEKDFKIIDNNTEKYNNFIEEAQVIISDEEYEKLEKSIFGL